METPGLLGVGLVEATEGAVWQEPLQAGRAVSACPLLSTSSYPFPPVFQVSELTKSVGVCSEGSKPSLRRVQGASDSAQLATRPDDLSLIPQNL